MGGQIFDQKPCSQPGLLGGIFHEADIAFRYVFLQLQLEDFLALQRHMGEGFRDKADSQIGADAGKNEIGGFHLDIRIQNLAVALKKVLIKSPRTGSFGESDKGIAYQYLQLDGMVQKMLIAGTADADFLNRQETGHPHRRNEFQRCGDNGQIHVTVFQVFQSLGGRVIVDFQLDGRMLRIEKLQIIKEKTAKSRLAGADADRITLKAVRAGEQSFLCTKSSSQAGATWSKSSSPSGVRATPFRVRMKSVQPSSCSRILIITGKWKAGWNKAETPPG